MTPQAIAFIGVGTMGGAIAEILVRSHEVHAYDADPLRVQSLAAKGARGCASAVEAAAGKAIVFTCLPRSQDVDQVLFGTDGIGPMLNAGSTVVDMTTGDPAITRSLGARLASGHVTLVDAAVAGGTDAAAAGKLTLYVGAEPDGFERIRPVLQTITTKVLHVGPPGCGQVMKLTNNVIGAVIRAVTCEAVAMAVTNGLSLETIADILPQGSARSYFAEIALPRYLQGVYRTNFATSLMVKDLQIAKRLGSDTRIPMPMADLALTLYQTMADEFGPAADVDTLLRLIEQRSGVQVAGLAAEA